MPYPPVLPPQPPQAPQFAYGQGGGTGGGGGGGSYVPGPAFRAWQSTAQSIPAATATKVDFQTEDWDTDSAFASSRFTAPIDGYYTFKTALGLPVNVTANSLLSFYKNGVVHTSGEQPDSSTYRLTASADIYLDAGEYVEVYAFLNAARTVQDRIDSTYFSGFMARPA